MKNISSHKIPMLLYHELFEGSANMEKYAMRADAFEEQVKYLTKNGFGTVSLLELLSGPQASVDKNLVSITFDDGYYSDYASAFPILQKFGCSATFFVTVNRIGTDHYVGWRQLKEMADAGMSIQSHSLNHVFLSDLNAEVLHRELHESKKILEQNLSRPVDFISLPGGFCSRRVIAAIEKTGYKGVVTSCPGLNKPGNKNSGYPVYKRFVITRQTNERSFQRILHQDSLLISKSRIVYQAKTLAKKALGSKYYYKIWSRFFKYKV